MATKKSSSPRATSSRVRTSKSSAAAAATQSATTNFHSGELQQKIQQRAYQLFQERGGRHGFDIEDWLRAESEVLGNTSK